MESDNDEIDICEISDDESKVNNFSETGNFLLNNISNTINSRDKNHTFKTSNISKNQLECPICNAKFDSKEVKNHLDNELNKLNAIYHKCNMKLPKKYIAENNIINKNPPMPDKNWKMYQTIKKNRQNRLKTSKTNIAVSCPVCNLCIKHFNIIRHVEECLRKKCINIDTNIDSENEIIDVEITDEEHSSEMHNLNPILENKNVLPSTSYDDINLQNNVPSTSANQISLTCMISNAQNSCNLENGTNNFDQCVNEENLASGEPNLNNPEELINLNTSNDINDQNESNIMQNNLNEDLNPENERLNIESNSESEDIVVDDLDEDVYGPMQYSETDIPRDMDTEFSRENEQEFSEEVERPLKSNLEISALLNKINELENRVQNVDTDYKCLICLDKCHTPVVSICCWHVHCESCWLKTLSIKKTCPRCKMITAPGDLRRIYL